MTKRQEGKIRKEVLDEVLKDYSTPEDLLGKNGIMAELKQRLIEAAMEAEMEDHLAYVKNGKRAEGSDNCRNGFSSKKVISNTGQIDIQIPRDREGNYEPLILPKHKRRFDGFDDKIMAMYARGMSVREIQATLLEIYNVEVSEGIITGVTGKVYDDVVSWQNRPLDPIYPLIFFGCIVVKSIVSTAFPAYMAQSFPVYLLPVFTLNPAFFHPYYLRPTSTPDILGAPQ